MFVGKIDFLSFDAGWLHRGVLVKHFKLMFAAHIYLFLNDNASLFQSRNLLYENNLALFLNS